MRLENKVALITGGGSGIGAATARLFAREGAKVVVTGRRPEPIETVASEIGGVSVAGDTSDPAHAKEAVAAAVSAFGGLDVVVAAAGRGGFPGAVAHSSPTAAIWRWNSPARCFLPTSPRHWTCPSAASRNSFARDWVEPCNARTKPFQYRARR
jgi:NAD(P)-dependent dehydrogenase (short-subunit alcohol dehydrogenase family)